MRRFLQFDVPDPIPEPESPVPPLVFPNERLVRERVVATMSLASIGADESDALWAVDWVDADWDGDPAPERHGRILVTAQLAVKGDFGDIFRVSYQVSFVASIG